MSDTQPPAQPAAPVPSAALDPVAADAQPALPPSIQKFFNQAETYLNKAVESAKPYTDAVAHKTEEVLHSIQGQASSTGAEGEKSAQGEVGVKGLFEQGLGRVGATLSNVTSTIDAKTATPNHPGWPTMLREAGKGFVERVEGVIESVGEHPASTSAAAAAVSPFQAPSRKSSIVDTTSTSTAAANPSSQAPTSTADIATPVTSGPNTASTSSAPIEGESKPVVTTTNSVTQTNVV
ncbi:hypothetical protein NliqN6_3120 [Naganishia liquefaciens]|uniref:Uncharacterized protein n=1 Tax=Naganishia liquefaciens TaxID=104408 RepID=A0A8H3TTQ9_9TREE|nr:hypothetical protein NliqN6_3120 [Naganishia liquefaciens]